MSGVVRLSSDPPVKEKEDIKIDQLRKPAPLTTGHKSTIAYKFMEIPAGYVNSKVPGGPQKTILGHVVYPQDFTSGGPGDQDGRRRSDSEPNAFATIFSSSSITGMPNPSAQGIADTSFLKRAIDSVLPTLKEGSKLRVKFYLQNSHLAPCLEDGRRGIPCETFLTNLPGGLKTSISAENKDKVEFRIKVKNPEDRFHYPKRPEIHKYGYKNPLQLMR
jgi:hypothetical protein